jgi:hypothetical protein
MQAFAILMWLNLTTFYSLLEIRCIILIVGRRYGVLTLLGRRDTVVLYTLYTVQ